MLVVLEEAGSHRQFAVGRHARAGCSHQPAAAEQAGRIAVFGLRGGNQQKDGEGACERGYTCRFPASAPGSGGSVAG